MEEKWRALLGEILPLIGKVVDNRNEDTLDYHLSNGAMVRIFRNKKGDLLASVRKDGRHIDFPVSSMQDNGIVMYQLGKDIQISHDAQNPFFRITQNAFSRSFLPEILPVWIKNTKTGEIEKSVVIYEKIATSPSEGRENLFDGIQASSSNTSLSQEDVVISPCSPEPTQGSAIQSEDSEEKSAPQKDGGVVGIYYQERDQVLFLDHGDNNNGEMTRIDLSRAIPMKDKKARFLVDAETCPALCCMDKIVRTIETDKLIPPKNSEDLQQPFLPKEEPREGGIDADIAGIYLSKNFRAIRILHRSGDSTLLDFTRAKEMSSAGGYLIPAVAHRCDGSIDVFTIKTNRETLQAMGASVVPPRTASRVHGAEKEVIRK